MSQEKVREILSHVDMTKIDLSSFKLSEKKFNELSRLYRNRVIISCVSLLIHKEEHDVEEVDVAFELVKKVVDNPNIYDYDTVYANERKAVDDAIDDITTRRDRNINDVKIKAIEKRMKDAYKQMRKTVELALEYGNSFEDEFNEEIVERCMKIAKDAFENSRRRVAETCVEAITQSQQIEEVQSKSNEECTKSNVSPMTNTHQEKTQKTKVSFWKRIFSKV